MSYRGMVADIVSFKGFHGATGEAYYARPSGKGPFPGVVLIHHLPGWSELYIETTRRFAHHGYMASCANLYEREGGGSDDEESNQYDFHAPHHDEGVSQGSRMPRITCSPVTRPRVLGRIRLGLGDESFPEAVRRRRRRTSGRTRRRSRR